MSRSAIRRNIDKVFHAACVVTAAISVAILAWLLYSIFSDGYASLTWDFIQRPPTQNAQTAGIGPAVAGTLWVCTLCAVLTLPIGIATAIMLEEFRPRSLWGRRVYGLIQLNITNLAGVPSVVYGILGLTAFVQMFGLFGVLRGGGSADYEIGGRYYDQFLTRTQRTAFVPVTDQSAPPTEPVDGMTVYMFASDDAGKPIIDYDQMIPVELNVIQKGEPKPTDPAVLDRSVRWRDRSGRVSDKAWYYLRLPLGRGVLAGALTLMLVVLPVIIISTQEALRAVPASLRDGARGLGATPWQVVWNVTLPAATPSILTGSILAMSRAIGETAPILIIAGIVYITTKPGHLMDDFTVLPLQIYNWIGLPQAEFRQLAAAGIIVLLAILLTFNAIAVFLRSYLRRDANV